MHLQHAVGRTQTNFFERTVKEEERTAETQAGTITELSCINLAGYLKAYHGQIKTVAVYSFNVACKCKKSTQDFRGFGHTTLFGFKIDCNNENCLELDLFVFKSFIFINKVIKRGCTLTVSLNLKINLFLFVLYVLYIND